MSILSSRERFEVFVWVEDREDIVIVSLFEVNSFASEGLARSDVERQFADSCPEMISWNSKCIVGSESEFVAISAIFIRKFDVRLICPLDKESFAAELYLRTNETMVPLSFFEITDSDTRTVKL